MTWLFFSWVMIGPGSFINGHEISQWDTKGYIRYNGWLWIPWNPINEQVKNSRLYTLIISNRMGLSGNQLIQYWRWFDDHNDLTIIISNNDHYDPIIISNYDPIDNDIIPLSYPMIPDDPWESQRTWGDEQGRQYAVGRLKGRTQQLFLVSESFRYLAW